MISTKRVPYFAYSIFLFLLILTSCVSKRMYKKGVALEKANMPLEAAGYYQTAVEKNAKNVDARIALKRTGQYVVDSYFKEFYGYYNTQENEHAVDKYRQVKSYYSHLRNLGVSLTWDDKSESYYEEVKDAFIAEAYLKGVHLLDEEKFREAAPVLDKVFQLNPNYREVKEKREVAIYEPQFRNAQFLLMEGAPRRAYGIFEKILSQTGDYKDTRLLKEEALEQATLTMVITPCGYANKMGTDARSISPMVVTHVKQNSSPFFRVKEDPKQAYFSLNYDDYIKYIYKLGANAIVKIDLLDVHYGIGDLEKRYKCAYTKSYVTYKDEEGNEKKKAVYHKTYYKEYSTSSLYRYRYQYSLVSTLTGEVLQTKTFDGRFEDKVQYALFKGNYRSLIPGYFESKDKKSDSDQVYDNERAIRELRKQFNARQRLLPVADFKERAVEDIAQKIAADIVRYNGDKQVMLEN